jgi:uncharacterized protein YegP (UPF0339 family)
MGVPGLKYGVYKDAKGEFRWRLKAGNGKIIADSGEGYLGRAECLHGISLVKASADAPVEDEAGVDLSVFLANLLKARPNEG